MLKFLELLPHGLQRKNVKMKQVFFTGPDRGRKNDECQLVRENHAAPAFVSQNTEDFEGRREREPPDLNMKRESKFLPWRTISPSSFAFGETCLGGCGAERRPEDGTFAPPKAPEDVLDWVFAGRMQKARAAEGRLDEGSDSFLFKGCRNMWRRGAAAVSS